MSEETKRGEEQDRRSDPDRRKENRGIRNSPLFRLILDRRKGRDRRSEESE